MSITPSIQHTSAHPVEPLWKEVMTKTMHVESKMRLHSFTYHVSVGVRGACIHVCMCVCVSECVCVKGVTVRQESQTQSTLPSGDHCSPSRSLVSVSKCCKQTLMLSNQSAQEACTPHKQIFISQLNPLLKGQTKGHHERILSPCTHCY